MPDNLRDTMMNRATPGPPTIRAATLPERGDTMMRDFYESAAEQPIVRILEMLGIGNVGGMEDQYTNPDHVMGGTPLAPPLGGALTSIPAMIRSGQGRSTQDLLGNPRAIEAMNRMSKEPNPFFSMDRVDDFTNSVRNSYGQMTDDLAAMAGTYKMPPPPPSPHPAVTSLQEILEAATRRASQTRTGPRPRIGGEVHGSPTEILD